MKKKKKSLGELNSPRELQSALQQTPLLVAEFPQTLDVPPPVLDLSFRHQKTSLPKIVGSLVGFSVLV